MANFSLVGWVDPTDLIASLRSRMPLFTGTGIRRLALRGPEKDGDPDDETHFVDRKGGPAGRWPECHDVVQKILHARPELALGRVYFELLDPGATIPLRHDTRPYALRHARLLVGVRCPPAAYLWCPPDVWLMQPGQVVLTQPALWHAAVNLGETPRITLVIDVKQETVPHDAPVLGRSREDNALRSRDADAG